MDSPKLYIIAGPNGAGKTTASMTILPELLDCREFVNADEIARGLSPLHPEEMAIQAGRLQLQRIEEIIATKATFALETTLATKSYINMVRKAQALGYEVILLFFWLPSVEMAKERVLQRVSEGGHNIPEEVIERRYVAGIRNLFQIFSGAVNEWYIYDNSYSPSLCVAECVNGQLNVHGDCLYSKIADYARK
ncbi:MAG: zeta toxin family protein [Bacteroidales bacterium]|nr:zeta toxin family protein [Bacteroidales bacterium]